MQQVSTAGSLHASSSSNILTRISQSVLSLMKEQTDMHCYQMFLFDIIKCPCRMKDEWQTNWLSSKKFIKSHPSRTVYWITFFLGFAKSRDKSVACYRAVAVAVASNHQVHAWRVWRVRSKSWSKSADNERISAENSCSAPPLSHLHENLPSPRTFPPFKLSPATLRLQAPTDSEDEHSIQLHGFPGQSQIRTIYGLSELKYWNMQIFWTRTEIVGKPAKVESIENPLKSPELSKMTELTHLQRTRLCIACIALL